MTGTSNYIIYCHINKINDWKYIGQTCMTTSQRWRLDGSGYKPHNGFINEKGFWAAIEKYGWDNFDHIILEKNLTKGEANVKETYWINYYHTWIEDKECKGYNLTLGGHNSLHNEITKNQMSEKKKENWKDSKYIQTKSRQSKELWNNDKYKEKTISNMKKYWENEENKNKARKRAIERGKHSFKTKCRCIETGIIYDSMAEAARDNGISNGTMISAVCRGVKKVFMDYIGNT